MFKKGGNMKWERLVPYIEGPGGDKIQTLQFASLLRDDRGGLREFFVGRATEWIRRANDGFPVVPRKYLPFRNRYAEVLSLTCFFQENDWPDLYRVKADMDELINR